MPARYHFDLESGHEAIRDEEGVVADDLDQAVVQAALGVQEMRAGGEFHGTTTGWSLVIRNEAGTEVKRIRL